MNKIIIFKNLVYLKSKQFIEKLKNGFCDYLSDETVLVSSSWF